MNHFLTTFLVPECGVSQATPNSPPAKQKPARYYWVKGIASIKFLACVARDAAGFGMLLAGSWATLQVMSAVMI